MKQSNLSRLKTNTSTGLCRDDCTEQDWGECTVRTLHKKGTALHLICQLVDMKRAEVLEIIERRAESV